MGRKIIITCAVTGNAPFNPKHPAFPVTPKQIAASVVEAAKAGAAIAHIHVRDLETKLGCADTDKFVEVVNRVRDSSTDIVINLTAGFGGFFLPDPKDESRGLPESEVMLPEERVKHLEICRPEIASLDVVTGNQVEGGHDYVYLNTTRSLRKMAGLYKELGVKPELEAFEVGDLLFANQMVEDGLVEGELLYQMVLGVKWASPPDAETIIYMRDKIPAGAHWTAMGIGRMQFPIAAMSVLMGGNVRVGLEDNLYLKKGVFATNGQLVERARLLVNSLGYETASPAEARKTLGLVKHGYDLPRTQRDAIVA